MAVTTPLAPSERRARTALLVASGVSTLGIALAATQAQATRIAGGVLLCGGWLLFAYALHAFGRAGSERE
jgi:hypothetical protein